MSNQVFANQSKKYFPCPGLNAYNLAAPVPILAAANADLGFVTPVVVQADGIVSTSGGPLFFLEDGLYSIKSIVEVTPAAIIDVVEFEAKLTLTGGYAASGSVLDIVRIANQTNKDYYVQTLSYTGYFNAAEFITARIINLGIESINCSSGVCKMFVCKLT